MSTAIRTDPKIASVLIATDFSPASEKPLQHALAIAHSFGAKFYVLNVVSSLGFTMAGPEATFEARQAICRDASRLSNSLFAKGRHGDLEHEVIVREGSVWQEVQAVVQEKKIDLTVIGTHGRRGLGKFVLGSVAEQIFRHATGPVLTVGPACYEDPRVEVSTKRRFLFATDFGDASLQALPYAASFANRFNAILVLYHVIPAVLVPENFKIYTVSDVQHMREEEQAASLKRLQWLIRETPLNAPPEFVIRQATTKATAECILTAANEVTAGLIVMGLRQSKRIGTASHVPWTTAYEVAGRACCPVLTVRSEA